MPTEEKKEQSNLDKNELIKKAIEFVKNAETFILLLPDWNDGTTCICAFNVSARDCLIEASQLIHSTCKKINRESGGESINMDKVEKNIAKLAKIIGGHIHIIKHYH
jgi:hypothetical protein